MMRYDVWVIRALSGRDEIARERTREDDLVFSYFKNLLTRYIVIKV